MGIFENMIINMQLPLWVQVVVGVLLVVALMLGTVLVNNALQPKHSDLKNKSRTLALLCAVSISLVIVVGITLFFSHQDNEGYVYTPNDAGYVYTPDNTLPDAPANAQLDDVIVRFADSAINDIALPPVLPVDRIWFSIPRDIPLRDGYEFIGWKPGTGMSAFVAPQIPPFGPLARLGLAGTMPGDVITFYAYWALSSTQTLMVNPPAPDVPDDGEFLLTIYRTLAGHGVQTVIFSEMLTSTDFPLYLEVAGAGGVAFETWIDDRVVDVQSIHFD